MGRESDYAFVMRLDVYGVRVRCNMVNVHAATSKYRRVRRNLMIHAIQRSQSSASNPDSYSNLAELSSQASTTAIK